MTELMERTQISKTKFFLTTASLQFLEAGLAVIVSSLTPVNWSGFWGLATNTANAKRAPMF